MQTSALIQPFPDRFGAAGGNPSLSRIIQTLNSFLYGLFKMRPPKGIGNRPAYSLRQRYEDIPAVPRLIKRLYDRL